VQNFSSIKCAVLYPNLEPLFSKGYSCFGEESLYNYGAYIVYSEVGKYINHLKSRDKVMSNSSLYCESCLAEDIIHYKVLKYYKVVQNLLAYNTHNKTKFFAIVSIIFYRQTPNQVFADKCLSAYHKLKMHCHFVPAFQ